MSTVADLQTLLSKYTGVGNTFTTQLNLVRERLIQDGAWPGMTPMIELDVFTDADGNPIVTLPRQFIAILRGHVKREGSRCRMDPMGTSGLFNEGLVGGPPLSNNFQECPNYYCIFQEWTGATTIRFKFEKSESAGTIYVAGTDDGEPVWNSNPGPLWQPKEAVAYVGTTTVDTVNTFDAPNLVITKPATTGRVFVYSVDSDGEETLVGIMQPGETFPQWRRYKVPCPIRTLSEAEDFTYACIVKLGYLPVTASTDEVVPNNIGALRFGLQALLKEDAEDYERAAVLWEMSRNRLETQAEGESEGTIDRIEILDDFNFEAVGTGL